MYGTASAAAVIPPPPSAALSRLRITLAYVWRHHRLPDLVHPQRFNELVQTRKLYDRSPAQSLLMDKLAAKSLASRMLGEAWVTPTTWAGSRLPDRPPFAFPAILKARHGCKQYAVIDRDPDLRRWRSLQQTSDRWVSRPYGLLLDEWAYRDVPRGLLSEPMLGNGVDLPIDYKIFVFGGQATHVQVHLDRRHNHRWILHDRDWRQLVPMPDTPPPPRSLPAMLAAAEALAVGMDFVRVDFYEVAGRPLFGEFCLYPGSGLDPFAADWIDGELGRLWLLARAQSHQGSPIRELDHADVDRTGHAACG